MAEVAKLERDALFKKLRAKPENKVRAHRGFLRRSYGVLYLVLPQRWHRSLPAGQSSPVQGAF